MAFARRRAVTASLIALLALGATVRFVGMRDAFVGFHSTRQYHCAIIARAFYYRLTLRADAPRRLVAERAREQEGDLEPPITERAVSIGYWLTHGEHVHVARAITATFWLLGSIPLFRFAAQLFSPAAALWAVAYYVLLPYGIIASQSFQPESLMIMLMLASWDALLVYHRRPTVRGLVIAGLVSGLAVVAKPVTGFSIVALQLVLMWRSRDVLSTVKSLDSWLLPLCLVLPSAAYYLPDMLQGGRLAGQAALSFHPDYLRSASFWLDWRRMLLRTSSQYPPLIAAALGVVVARAGKPRRVLIALWLGYLAYGVTFSYHIMSHDYYQLPCVPVIGLSIAGLANGLRRVTRRFDRVLAFTVRMAFAVLTIGLAGKTRAAIELEAYPRTHREPGDESVYEAIGREVEHSLHVVYLTTDSYGGPLMFYGELAGWYWPTQRDIHNAAKRGRAPFDPVQRLAEHRAEQADFFVVSPADELPKQRSLDRLLRQRFALRASTPQYLIFDLRQEL